MSKIHCMGERKIGSLAFQAFCWVSTGNLVRAPSPALINPLGSQAGSFHNTGVGKNYCAHYCVAMHAMWVDMCVRAPQRAGEKGRDRVPCPSAVPQIFCDLHINVCQMPAMSLVRPQRERDVSALLMGDAEW